MTNTQMATRLNEYVELVNELNEAYFARMGWTYKPAPTAKVRMGKKFAKVVTGDFDEVYTGEMVHTFISMQNGDILKAGSYKAPAKNGVRGNIFASDLGKSCITEPGARYIH